MEKISAPKAAKLLGISSDKLNLLEQQGLIHSTVDKEGLIFFSYAEIARIKSSRAPTLSEEAAQVGIQIQREVVTSVSGLQKLKRRVGLLSILAVLLFTFSAAMIAALFEMFPESTSDFFGYYYRFNKNENEVSSTINPNVLAAADSIEPFVKTSIIADIIKPVADTSLIAVKAIDSQKYQQIVTNPTLGVGLPGPPGPEGPSGPSGKDGVSATDLDISDLTNVNLSGSAGITNENLANSSLTITTGNGLVGGGVVALGSTTTLDISLATNSGLEMLGSSLTLLQGCADGQILKWTNTGGWACAADLAGSDLLHAASYDTSEDLTNITSVQTTLGTVSVTPTTETADVYVTGQAEVLSSNAADQPFTLVVETTSNCTGSTVGNATVTYLITSGASGVVRGVLEVSGVALNPGALQQSYSLCASTSAGDSNVQSWTIEALVIN